MFLHLSEAIDEGLEESEILTESIDSEATWKERQLRTIHGSLVHEEEFAADDDDMEEEEEEEEEGLKEGICGTDKELDGSLLTKSSSRRCTSLSVKDMFQVPEIPIYYKNSNKFQRLHIDEIDDEDDDVDDDAREASIKILRALEIHERWTNVQYPQKKVVEDERRNKQLSSLVSLTKSNRGNIHKKEVDQEKKEAHYRREDEEPEYDPFVAANEAKNIDDWSMDMVDIIQRDGVWQVVKKEESTAGPTSPTNKSIVKDEKKKKDVFIDIYLPSLKEYAEDYWQIRQIVNSGPVKSFSYTRLAVLEDLFNLHVLLNCRRELRLQKSVPHRDFYNVRKVDTHVHHSACMNQKHLLRFIKAKLRKFPQEIVLKRDGENELTLEGVFKSLRLTAYDLSIDTLDMHAHDTFHRFDRFNLKYNPAGQSRLREIFLKTDNYIHGKYLAEITKEVISDLESSKYQFAEWRISIYGRNHDEWSKLADWFYMNKVYSRNVRWIIQIPRLYTVYKKSGQISSFSELLTNIFQPLFQITLNPSLNPRLHALLGAIVGFDSVDDESKSNDDTFASNFSSPHHLPNDPTLWTVDQEPSYAYWIYYLYINIRSLNNIRAQRGFSLFEFRPHCGEAGDIGHLISAFLTTNKINHGIQLKKSPALQYLYYLTNIGIAMSPLSNNRLFLEFSKNPFPRYFKRGLNVSLSTDDPLMLHFTKDPLVEEYSVAAQIWKLSSIDICEIARNSVLQSGLEHRFKRHYLGDNYDQPGAAGNDIRMTNVPDIRVTFRFETHQNELKNLRSHQIAFYHQQQQKEKQDYTLKKKKIQQHYSPTSASFNAPHSLTVIRNRMVSSSSL